MSLRKPDRVPVVPDFDVYIAKHAGITMRELLFDLKKAEAALDTAYRDFRFDGHHLFLGGCGPYIKVGLPQRFRLPGEDGVGDDEPMQAIEEEAEGPEVYDEIREKGFTPVYLRCMRKANGDPGLARSLPLAAGLAGYLWKLGRHVRKWERRGVPCLGGTPPNVLPFDVLSGTRSMAEFAKDLYRRPEAVLAALPRVSEFCTRQMILTAKAAGTRYCFVGSARSSATFISPRLFERFALPSLVEAVRKLVEAGLVPFLHFDSDWTPMLPYLKELPRGSCILDLDGTTDIFKAKEVLGGHLCLMGDVPAAMMKLAQPEEVDAYCARLIREVGAGGGFILSSGCSIPADAKSQNVRALIESVNRHKA